MEPEIINIYIEKLLAEVGEAAKSRVLLDTQLKYTQTINQNLSQKIQELEAQIQTLSSQIEKQNKKKTKEVDTSSTDTF